MNAAAAGNGTSAAGAPESERAPRRLSSMLDEKAVAEAVTEFKAAQSGGLRIGPFAVSDLLDRLWRARFLAAFLIVAPWSIVWSTRISAEFENVLGTLLALLLFYDLLRDVFQQTQLFPSIKACHASAGALVTFGTLCWAIFAQFSMQTNFDFLCLCFWSRR